MRAAPNGAPTPGRTRRWRVPPPITRGGELLEGAEILDEVTGATAVLLWKSLRSVTLWAGAAPSEQASLFADGARQRREAELLTVTVDDALVEPLRVFAELLGRAGEMPREAVAVACRQVAQWAETTGAPMTQLAFTQAAAVALPGDADLAYQVGRLARQQVQHARAESWYRRAVMLGRQSGSWDAYARAYVGLGNLAMQRGSLPHARRAQIKALRASRRHRLAEPHAWALHDLFLIASESEDARAAQRFARAAFRRYGPGHANVPALVHDVCVLWVREGEFARAQRVLRSLAPQFRGGLRLLALANLARAAGSAGDAAEFDQAWAEAHELLARQERNRWTAQSLLNLARGAAALQRWDRAEEAADRALQTATATGENNLVFEAESVLESARLHRGVTVPQHATRAVEWQEEAEQLEGELLHALTSAA